MPEPVVVLIEDEAQIRRFLRATLTGQGYRLFETTTGADGVVEVASRQPDVVIVDLGLPDMDGLEVIRRLREWTAVPVIAAFKVGDLQVDLLRRHVSMRGADVRLTPIEYKLLATLVKHAGKVVTHQQLLRDVWGPSHEDQSHYVRVYMAHLRHKLETEPARPRYLLTEPGVGYRLAVD
jgi:two-component system KDP operon response regulator KdpE